MENRVKFANKTSISKSTDEEFETLFVRNEDDIHTIKTKYSKDRKPDHSFRSNLNPFPGAMGCENEGNANEEEFPQASLASLPKEFKIEIFESLKLAKQEIVKLSNCVQEMNEEFQSEKEQMEHTIKELQEQVDLLRKDKSHHRDNYIKSLQEIEDKSERVSQELTNSLIDNACLRDENVQLRTDQDHLLSRISELEQKLDRLESEQPRVQRILKSLEKREQGLKLQIKRLSELEAAHRKIYAGVEATPSTSNNNVVQPECGSTPATKTSSKVDYVSLIEKAKAICEKHHQVELKPEEKTKSKMTTTSGMGTSSTAFHRYRRSSHHKYQQEEEDMLRELFFLF